MHGFQTAKINGIAIRYEVQGAASAPAVVLHHPLATNLTFWDEAIAALSPNYRVIRFDARARTSYGTCAQFASSTVIRLASSPSTGKSPSSSNRFRASLRLGS